MDAGTGERAAEAGRVFEKYRIWCEDSGRAHLFDLAFIFNLQPPPDRNDRLSCVIIRSTT